MPVKKNSDGRRSVEVEIEVPGTPEEVWKAIATGPGISSWFVPTRVDQRVGGAITFQMAPGMDSPATVTSWDPPHQLTYEERDWAPTAPPLATEIIVEARSAGRCVVRLVSSLFASGEDWDNQLESFESGWPVYFRVLRLYMTHFRGQPCSTIQVMVPTSRSESKAWDALTGALGLAGISAGKRAVNPRGVPPFAGVVEWLGTGKNLHHALLRLDEPAPGAACVNAFTWNGVHVGLAFYLYGDRAAAAVARDEPLWRALIKERFDSVADLSTVAHQ
jgi:uncharacterized protein YndB with AHSA1/START domain